MKKKEAKASSNQFFDDIGDYIKKKYPFLILFIVGFLTISAINFLKICTAQSVASFVLNDFEIGQISDTTIIASRSLQPTEGEPVSIVKGEKIIRKGFVIDEDGYAKLSKMASSPEYIDYRVFADNEIFLLVLGIFWFILFSIIPFGRKIELKEPLLHFVFFLLVYTIAAFGQKFEYFSSPYSICVIIPSCLFIMLVVILYGQLSAILLSFIFSIGVFQATNWGIFPFLFTLATTFSAIVIVRQLERRLDLVFASIMLSILDMLFLMMFKVIFNESIGEAKFIFIGVALNGFFSGILTIGFMTPLEILMNTASVFRLMDLSDLNNPLLRNMCVNANGTYQHSLMVAQLAEAACKSIGTNALLARVASYYHDIGKIDQSEYFVENQRGVNKHDDLNPSLSVSIIRSHVKKGIEKAHQLHLPEQIVTIISEHHGNSVISFFYTEAKSKDPTLKPEDFSYSGNPPSTKVSAVVMLADTVEAACRTLENPSVIRLEKFIHFLINAKIEAKQLDNCNLTFRDISKIKEAFVQILVGFYHSRIEYPDQNQTIDKIIRDENEK
jgi:cyclic-di-AMP phosphodiesterase PgpH